jgi:hypothetical protein
MRMAQFANSRDVKARVLDENRAALEASARKTRPPRNRSSRGTSRPERRAPGLSQPSSPCAAQKAARAELPPERGG